MLTADDDAAAVRLPPPLVALCVLGFGFALHWIWPLRLPLPTGLRLSLGALLLLAAVRLVVGAMGLFKRSGQNPEPWKTTPSIITTGVYARTRNPMYLAMGISQASMGLLADAPAVLVLVPLTWRIIFATAIVHEEAYLERKFGQAYRDYTRRVRRWL